MTSFLKSLTLVKNCTEDHQNNLLNAARGLLNQDENVAIYSGELSEKILFNKKLLLLFSKTIRSCFAEDPCCAPQPSLVVPSIPGKIVAKIQEILLKTVFEEQINVDDHNEDLEKIVDAAEILGIEIKNIRIMANLSQKKEPISSQILSVKPPEVVDVFDEDKPLQINVDISSDEEEDGNDFDSDEERELENFNTAQLAVQNALSKFSTNPVAAPETEADLILAGAPEFQVVGDNIGNAGNAVHGLLEEEEDSDSEDESLQEEPEENEPEQPNEKISFSFLKKEYNSDISPTSGMASLALQLNNEIVNNNSEDIKEDAKKEGPDSIKSTDDLGLCCKLCGKPQKGPSALREHYASTHFFQELYDIYVAGTTSESWCTMEGCNKDYRDRKCLVRHIGSTHHKVLPILEQNGLQIPEGIKSAKRRKSEKLDRSVKIKLEEGETNKTLSTESNHYCEQCEKYYSSKSNLERHQRTQHLNS